MNMPEGLKYWRADSVAECLSFDKHLPDDYEGCLYRRLWGFSADAENPTPLGGDGTDGTVEYPDGQRSLHNDDKAGHWWHRLTEAEQAAIAAAYAADYA